VSIDGYVLHDAICNIFASFKQNEVDVISGWNGNDGYLSGPPKKSVEDFKKQITQKYGTDAQTLLKFYLASTDSEAMHHNLK
jgi:para-nitrobenzyl esterase